MSCDYALTTLLLFSAKRHFFEDSLSTLPLMTYFFSIAATFIYWLLLLILDRQFLPLSFAFVGTDLFIMPLADAAFAALSFSLPALFFGKPIRKGSDYFLNAE